MKKSIKLLYKYLMSNQHQVRGWYKEYVAITKSVGKIKDNLLVNSNLSLNDNEVYEGTGWSNKDQFIKDLFKNTSNGIASNGRSILSNIDREKITGDNTFLAALKSLISDPSKSNHAAFAKIWKEKIGQNNPVHTNRATSACNLDISSTVDIGKFDQLFNWLQQFNYIDKYQGENNWYDKNIFLTTSIQDELQNNLEDEFPDVDDHWINIFIWLIYENLSNPFSLKKQVVKYGAPGTGKTYQAKETAKMQFQIWKHAFGQNSNLTFEESCVFVQFHPSYTYEDFMEGLRPVPDGKGQIQLKLTNGVFKQHCTDAGKWERDLYGLELKNIEDLQIKDLPKEELIGDHWKTVLEANPSTKVMDALPPYFVLIDEINRAELSRVFGELMYCLEYRGLDGIIKTQYAQLNTEETGMLKVGRSYQFFIPSNLYIIASMNTVDRSVDSFDFALRRRFRWEEVQPDIQLLRYHLNINYNKWVGLADSLKNLNDLIRKEPILGKDYCIGHAYLWSLRYSDSTSITDVKKLVWEDNISALIEEYLRGSGKENLYHIFYESFVK